ncbi:hypothetical protein XENOCAPTIV_014388 [Xenoophorus captivus]|uniref:Uncharacterized protein n=1 Tax=Xenoophorus captivus TaxID=1517983 RepID=A0ABV0RAK3_9TELE
MWAFHNIWSVFTNYSLENSIKVVVIVWQKSRVCVSNYVTWKCTFVSVTRTVEGLLSTATKSNKGQVDPAPEAATQKASPQVSHKEITEVDPQRPPGWVNNRRIHACTRTYKLHTERSQAGIQTQDLLGNNCTTIQPNIYFVAK